MKKEDIKKLVLIFVILSLTIIITIFSLALYTDENFILALLISISSPVSLTLLFVNIPLSFVINFILKKEIKLWIKVLLIITSVIVLWFLVLFIGRILFAKPMVY